jgi:hypothetical protein
LGGGSLVRDGDHKVKPDVAEKNLSDYFYEKVAKPDEKPVITTKSLTDDLTDTKLGELPDKSESTIKTALTNKNKNLNVSQITITDITDTGATVNVIKDSTVYDAGGSVPVTFTIANPDTSVDLNTIITDDKKDLGEIEAATEEAVKEALTKKIPDLKQEEVTIAVDTEANTATITPNKDSKVYKGDPVTVSFTIDAGDTTVALDTIITDLNLGEITSLDVDSVKAALTKKFANLDQNEITITMGADGASTATIAANKDSTVYSGSVEVEFTVKKDTKPLNEVLTETKLGEIDKVDSDTILAAVETANANNDIDISQLEVVDSPTNEKATIKVKDGSEVYTAGGTVDVTYTVTPTTKDLTEDITTKTLVNPLDNFEDTTILDAVKAESPELEENEVEVVEGATDTAATIKVKDGSEVYTAGGTVDVTFSVAAAPTMNYYSILNVHHLLADGPEYSYDDYTMTIMIGSEDLFNLDNKGYVYIPFTILPE